MVLGWNSNCLGFGIDSAKIFEFVGCFDSVDGCFASLANSSDCYARAHLLAMTSYFDLFYLQNLCLDSANFFDFLLDSVMNCFDLANAYYNFVYFAFGFCDLWIHCDTKRIRKILGELQNLVWNLQYFHNVDCHAHIN